MSPAILFATCISGVLERVALETPVCDQYFFFCTWLMAMPAQHSNARENNVDWLRYLIDLWKEIKEYEDMKLTSFIHQQSNNT